MHHHGRKRSKSAWIFLGVMTLAAGAQAQALLTRESGAPVDLYAQVLKPEQLKELPYDPPDPTKVWPGIPETKLGTMTLNRVPADFFQETEQSAFAPVRMVPGIEPSEDRLLQGRLFSYADTQTYRLGVNNQQLPVNRPLSPVRTYHQDGLMNAGQTSSDVRLARA